MKELISFALIILAFPLSGSAQMFSVDDSSPVRQQLLGTETTISIGWEIGEFDNRNSNLIDIDDYSFDDSILRFRLESPGIDIGLGLGGSVTGMNNNSYVNIAGRLHNNLNIYSSDERNFLLQLPIQITTDLKRVQQNNTDSEFQQSSFIVGSGIRTVARLSERFDFSLKATPNYGFSFSQGSLFGGNLFRFDGATQLLIKNVIGQRGIALGYHFDFRRYDIDGDQNDYDYTSHSISIGITL
jgi:hypothetical protein